MTPFSLLDGAGTVTRVSEVSDVDIICSLVTSFPSTLSVPGMERKQQKSLFCVQEDVVECKQQLVDFCLSDVPLGFNPAEPFD